MKSQKQKRKMMLKEQIKERKEKLNNCRTYLKGQFFGIDEQIDALMDSIDSWYCGTEIVTKPIIVNLWGMTGTGKTDLIRKLVKYLGMENQFFERALDLDEEKMDDFHDTLQRDAFMIDFTKPNVFLLDEFQKFRTKSEDGGRLYDLKWQDIWTMFSDGKFFNNNMAMHAIGDVRCQIKEMEEMLKEEYEEQQRQLEEVEEPEESGSEPSGGMFIAQGPNGQQIARKYTGSGASLTEAFTDFRDNMLESMSEATNGLGWRFTKALKEYYTSKFKILNKEDQKKPPAPPKKVGYILARESKLRYGMVGEIKDLMVMEIPTFIEQLLDHLENDLESFQYWPILNKSLIVISGNLDPLYEKANDVDDPDADADQLWELTKDINLIDVKAYLGTLFYPEQVARMGNNHIIYPSLNKKAFEDIIEKELNTISRKCKENADINVTFDKSIIDLIYENGVFPSQGARPVFQTIRYLVEAKLPNFIIEAVNEGVGTINLSYEEESKCLVASGFKRKEKINPNINKIREDITEDEIANCSVHEAGHAISYAVLYGYAPLKILSKSITRSTAGYVRLHQHEQNKENIKKYLICALSGLAAEEIVFNKDLRSRGCVGDLSQATKLAMHFVRDYGMHSGHLGIYSDNFESYISDPTNSTGAAAQTLLNEAKDEAQKLLLEHKEFLKAVSMYLVENNGKISTKEFKHIAAEKANLLLKEAKTNERLTPPYKELLETF
jgi:Cdc6-like AAA superfamily ATPase